MQTGPTFMMGEVPDKQWARKEAGFRKNLPSGFTFAWPGAREPDKDPGRARFACAAGVFVELKGSGPSEGKSGG